MSVANTEEKTAARQTNVAGKKARSGPRRKATESKPLDSELELLRDSLFRAYNALADSDEDMAKSGMLVARLSDSIGRALLAQQKLTAGSDGASMLEADFDNTLRAMGLGEI